MSTELTQEDKNILDTFLDQLKQASIVGTEVSMQTLGNYVANSAPEQISHMSRMFKVYGYTGVFFAVKDSLTQGSSDPFLKYALGTLGYMIAAGTGCITGPAFLVAFGIGILVGILLIAGIVVIKKKSITKIATINAEEKMALHRTFKTRMRPFIGN